LKTLHAPSFQGTPLRVAVISIDDFYLQNKDQRKLAEANPQNPLVQHRGQPSTHDIHLAASTLNSLSEGKPTKIPRYDKSAFNGRGDREPESEWEAINSSGPASTVDIVILEGWCVGFRSLPPEEVKKQWQAAVELRKAAEQGKGEYNGRLGWNRLEDVLFVNEQLKKYDELTRYAIKPCNFFLFGESSHKWYSKSSAFVFL
jgi:D-glycerate 3-kinase